MKRILTILASVVLGGTAFAASDTYFNASVVTNTPQIDATNFINWGTFTTFTSELPYSTRNTRYFTNRGVISGSVGFQLDTVSDTLSTPPRRPLTSFYNGPGASISAQDSGITTFFNGFGGSGGFGASILKVSATNLVNHGTLEVGTVGLMQLTGKSVDLSRGALAAGQVADSLSNNFFFGNNFFGNQYVNPFGVEDIYWGAGPFTINLANGSFGYTPPNIYTPPHAVQVRSSVGGLGGGIFGLLQSLPTTFPADFGAFANVNQFGTNIEIQVVFLKTNFTDTNISAEVRFGFSGFGLPAGQTRNIYGEAAIVQFSVTNEFDPITGQPITNSVYFIDDSAEQTTLVLLTNALSINGYARPSGYEIDTSTPIGWSFAQPPNTNYDPTLLFPGNTYSDKAGIAAFYGAYSAKIGRNPESLSGTTFNTNNFFNFGFFNDTFLLFPDPTNQPGRIEINADKLDLTLARIRTEGLLSMNAKHLAGGGAADVSAGIINADLGSTNGSMTISNIFPSHFKRVRGDLFAWSAIWENTETNAISGTNHVSFHVLVLDHDLKADFKPTIRSLALRSTNLVVKDDLTIVRSAIFQAENLTFEGNITLSGQAMDLHAANLIGVKNFLNDSNAVFQGANDAFFGYDPYNLTGPGWDSIINRGIISAVAPLFKATEFENSGMIFATNGGSVIIKAENANLSNGSILADRNITLSARNLIATNSIITAGQPDLLGQLQFGQLTLDVTDRLTDLTPFGGSLNNFWQMTDGIIMQQKPLEGDLLGTEIHTIASGFQESQTIWAGDDVGTSQDGYFNNVAVGHLILDLRNSASRLRFSGTAPDSHNAMYVVNLDFQVTTNVDINTSLGNLLSVDENMRIYFINSNAGDKLTTAFPDRIVRVDDSGFFAKASPLTVTARGLGIVAPNLDGKTLTVGSTYKMKATAGAGHIFGGWTGGTNASNPSLTFKMTRNLYLQANFVPNPFDAVKGVYNGLFYDAVNGIRHESSGFINFNLTKKGVVTGKLISGKAYPFTGKLDSAGHAEINVTRPKKSSLKLVLQLDLGTQSEQAHGNVSGENWTAAFVGDRTGSSTGHAGKYTLVIAGANQSGDGFGTAIVSASGAVRFKGSLSDGTKIQQQAGISKNGQWPFYVPLYKGEGSVLSWITLTNEPNGGLGGDLSWFQKGSFGSTTNLTVITGSPYSPPAKGARVLEITNGTVILEGGNLNYPITNQVEITSGVPLIVTGTNQLSLSISLPDGLLSGHFLHPDTKAITPIKGVVLQRQNSARGFFLGTNQSGTVLLESN